jgi:transcriptional regulator GlxA family with amidase domain
LGSFELASTLTKILLIDPGRRLQTPYQTNSLNKSHGNPEIRAVQDWLEENIDQPISIADMAGQAGMGERTFMRRFKKLIGDTPIGYLQQLRIETARRLLETTTATVEEITFMAGYQDVSSFRKLFKKQTGLSPSAYRKRFSCLIESF